MTCPARLKQKDKKSRDKLSPRTQKSQGESPCIFGSNSCLTNPIKVISIEGWFHALTSTCSLEQHISLFLLFVHDLEVLVNDCHREEDSCAATDGSQEVCHNGEHANAHTTEGSSCRDIHLKHVQER